MESDYIFHIGGAGGHFVSALIGKFVHNDTANVKVTHSNNEYKYFGDKIKARHLNDLHEEYNLYEEIKIKDNVYIITDRTLKATHFVRKLFNNKVTTKSDTINAKNLSMDKFNSHMQHYSVACDILKATDITVCEIDYFDFFVKQDVLLLKQIFQDNYTVEIRDIIKDYHLKNVLFLSENGTNYNPNTLDIINTLL